MLFCVEWKTWILELASEGLVNDVQHLLLVLKVCSTSGSSSSDDEKEVPPTAKKPSTCPMQERTVEATCLK